MHGGVKFYRGSASAARNYVEADRSRADDYYLTEGSGIAQHFVATNHDGDIVVAQQSDLDGNACENWALLTDPWVIVGLRGWVGGRRGWAWPGR